MSPEHGSPNQDDTLQSNPFGGPVFWDKEDPYCKLQQIAVLRRVLRRIRETGAKWVLAVRTPGGSAEVYYYAFRSTDLEDLVMEYPEREQWPVELAMDMHESMSSASSLSERPLGQMQGGRGLSAARIVDFDAAGRVVEIGLYPGFSTLFLPQYQTVKCRRR